MNTRRVFLKDLLLGAGAGLAALGSRGPALGQSRREPGDPPWPVAEIIDGQALRDRKPLVISTWNFGVQANAAAWQVLGSGGRALDAVERGVMVVEADPDIHSVGYGGLPDRDGHVTLDACIMDETGNAGSVSFLEGFRHPVCVARKVMEETPPRHAGRRGRPALRPGDGLSRGRPAHRRGPPPVAGMAEKNTSTNPGPPCTTPPRPCAAAVSPTPTTTPSACWPWTRRAT